MPAPKKRLLLHDLSNRHAPEDLRDSNLHLVSDLGPGDEHDEVLDPGQSVSFPSHVLDLRIVDLPLFDRGRPSAPSVFRHAALPFRLPAFGSTVRFVGAYKKPMADRHAFFGVPTS